MKEELEHINLTPEFLHNIINKIELVNHEDFFPETAELKKALENLENGSISYLLLELNKSRNELKNTPINEKIIKTKDLTIFVNGHKVTKNNKEITLTPKEFDILYFLAKNPGEVFTKEQIYQAVWAEGYLLDDSNIMAFIRKLRKKIETNPDCPEYILTIWGIGYKFNENL